MQGRGGWNRTSGLTPNVLQKYIAQWLNAQAPGMAHVTWTLTAQLWLEYPTSS